MFCYAYHDVAIMVCGRYSWQRLWTGYRGAPNPPIGDTAHCPPLTRTSLAISIHILHKFKHDFHCKSWRFLGEPIQYKSFCALPRTRL